jgi:hypothetical protein
VALRRKAYEKVISVLMLSLVQWIILARDAHAYIDPGTGSYILQMTLAAFFGAFFVVKQYWARIRSFLRAVLGKKHDDRN